MANQKRGYRSLFWPIVLISVGLIWLLGNLGVLGAVNLQVLFRIWPIFLIAIGLDLLIGRGSPAVGAVIALGTIALTILLMLAGPSLGLVTLPEIKQASLSEPLGEATAADIQLNLSVGKVTVSALSDSANLIEADLNYVGEIDFRAQGTGRKTVILSQTGEVTSTSAWPFVSLFPNDDSLELLWDIRLSPEVPLAIDINGGVGETSLALGGLQLTSLSVDGGVGEITVDLPAGVGYEATFNGGVGEFRINVPEGAAPTIRIKGGVGGFTVDVPDGAALRVEADTGLGEVDMLRGAPQILDDDDNQIWETADYAGAAQRILIVFEGGVGGLTVR